MSVLYTTKYLAWLKIAWSANNWFGFLRPTWFVRLKFCQLWFWTSHFSIIMIRNYYYFLMQFFQFISPFFTGVELQQAHDHHPQPQWEDQPRLAQVPVLQLLAPPKKTLPNASKWKKIHANPDMWVLDNNRNYLFNFNYYHLVLKLVCSSPINQNWVIRLTDSTITVPT